MSVHKTPPTLVVFLLSISEVVTQYGWAVIYSYESKCVLKGSTVAMGCTYQYPDDYVIRKTFWSTKQVISNVEPPDLSLDPEYRDRIQFLGDTQSNCTLRLRNVTENDTRQYYFRFLTTTDHGKFQGIPGIQLFITDLQVETPETVLEGEDVTLTCNTTCSLSQPKYTWYKNGVSLSTTTSLASNKHLLLKTISKNDVNSYSCGVLGQSHQSSAVTLDVRYPPKNVSVSISPSGEIVEGSSITLTCSSDANPPAKYTWFKGHTSFSGGIYTIANISSEDSKEYKCKYFNKYGTKYLTVPLNVLYPPKNVSVSISPSGEIVEASLVTLTCNSDANPPVQNYTWFREGGTSPVGSGQSYIIYDSGLYYCVVQNKYGIQRSAVVPVTLKARFSMIFYVILGVCLIVATILLSGVFWTRRKRSAAFAEDSVLKRQPENIYSNITAGPTSDPASNLDMTNQDGQYASVVPLQPTNPWTPESSAVNVAVSEPDEEDEYASVQHKHYQCTEKTLRDDIQYASVTFSCNGPARRSAAPSPEDASVIYSSVN